MGLRLQNTRETKTKTTNPDKARRPSRDTSGWVQLALHRLTFLHRPTVEVPDEGKEDAAGQHVDHRQRRSDLREV
eukprot:987708-Rhodomonas_salina.1